MSREIRFRVWVEAPDGEKGMHYPKLISFGSGQLSWATLQDDSVIKDNGWYTKREVMQFTGLHDKHGKDAYERDIILVDAREGEPYKGVLQWSEGLVGFGFYDLADEKIYRLMDVGSKFEVVGNTYEN